MIIHIVLVALFIVNIIVAIFLKKLNKIIDIRVNILTYLKIIILLLIWIINIVLSFILPTNDILYRIIYLVLATIVFAICVLIIGKQEKSIKSNLDIMSTWKRVSKDLNVNFLIRKYNTLEFPIIYGNYQNSYIEIFPYIKGISDNIKSKETDNNKIILVRVFIKEKPSGDKNIFSFENNFLEKYTGFSYLETHISPDWSEKTIPELPDAFTDEVKTIIKSSKESIKKL